MADPSRVAMASPSASAAHGAGGGADPRQCTGLPPLVLLEVVPAPAQGDAGAQAAWPGLKAASAEAARPEAVEAELVPLTAAVARRIPYVLSALSSEWRPARADGASAEASPPRVSVFLPAGCPAGVVRALAGRLAADADGASREHGLALAWRPSDVESALQLVQVASMLQLDELLPELAERVRGAVASGSDLALLEATCRRLELPQAVRDVAEATRRSTVELSLPGEAQVRGMIASALHTADGKVWRVVQKVIDRREAWPRLASENAAILLAFATGAHGSIRATPHTGFFWGSRDFLYLVCRYICTRSERFDAMVTAMFDSVYSMDPELPAEIIDAVFKELLVHEGLSFGQCEHVITKMMQREDQLEYLFHEWSGVFPTLPPNARRALAKGLLPAVGRCPHTALDFVLKELDAAHHATRVQRRRKGTFLEGLVPVVVLIIALACGCALHRVPVRLLKALLPALGADAPQDVRRAPCTIAPAVVALPPY